MSRATRPLLDSLRYPCAVVCHDAGGANVIFAAIAGADRQFRVYAEGPAARLAEHRLDSAWRVPTIDGALDDACELLTGAGWESDLEHEARRSARDRGIPSTTLIDHWVNYPERFSRNGQTVLPDRFWVTDLHAEARAHRHFDPIKIELVPNYYLSDEIARIRPAPEGSRSLLYILEPIRADWGRVVAGEFLALDFLVSMLPRLEVPADLSIHLRLHPSEPAGKYDAWISAHPQLRISLDESRDMAEAISASPWVAGCESYGLVLALEAKRRVYCTLPPFAPECRLPHPGLIHLKRL